MRLRILLFIPFFLLLTAWGFFGHRTINNTAIYALPEPLIHFYKAHANYLTEHSVDADKRRHMVEEEPVRHYLDADYYEQALPLDTIPHYWNQAIQCFSEDTIKAYGIGPWHLEKQVYFLQKAFSEKDIARILKLSADVGHYTADLHVPLHTSLNYNGQLTNQVGIHAFWESRLPELFAEDYSFFVGKAEYIPNINKAIWTAFEASVAARDSVLRFEKQLDSTFKGEKYAFEDRGKGLVKTYSKAYSKAYHEMLSGQVERRMQAAIKLLADLWYTAWVNAGSPDLGEAPKLAPPDSSELVSPKLGDHD
ncbi:MAG: S1/P1 Nuclease [Bacteroidetes bacterium]|nr:MAG: S1/P1 Nuclease [Bacteroidota bacterium]